MTGVARILNAMERGEAKATDERLPLVYEELWLLAAQKKEPAAPMKAKPAGSNGNSPFERVESWEWLPCEPKELSP